jgi:hypothetical protein
MVATKQYLEAAKTELRKEFKLRHKPSKAD